MVLILLLAFSLALAQEQGRVLAGLGAGVRGNAVFLASAEMMRGGGASLLINATRLRAREQLLKVRSELEEHHAEEFEDEDDKERKDTPLVVGDVPLVEPLLRRIVRMVTPQMNDTRVAVHELLTEILRFEHMLRRSIDGARASVQERQQHVSARHVFLLDELVAVDLATKLNDGLVLRQALGPNATQEQFRKLSHKHDRLYAQITRVARRLMSGEMRAQRVAGRLLVDVIINKVAVLESVISRVLYRMLSVYNQRGGGADELVTFLNEMVAEVNDMEDEESRLFATSGALLAALAVTNERTIETLVSEMLNVTNKTITPEQLEIQEAFDIAVARRNARVFTHRAIRTMEALFEKNPISERADAIRRVSAEAAHRLFVAEQVAVEGRIDGRSYFAAKASDFDLEALVTGAARPTNVSVAPIDTRDFLRLSRSIDRVMDADALGIVNQTALELADEEPVHKGDAEHAERLSYDLMRLAESEAAFYRAEELLQQGKHADAISNLTKAEQLLSEFLQPHPDAASYRENVDLGGEPLSPELARRVFSNRVEMEQHLLNNIQSSVVQTTMERIGKDVPWGKFGHHGVLRNRIFRNGVAVERLERPSFLSPTRYRLDRLERALKGANLQFGHNTRRRLEGIGQGESRLAQRILGDNGELEEGTANRFEDDAVMARTLEQARDRSKAARDEAEKEALHTVFDVAATGKLSDEEGDTVKLTLDEFNTAKQRENVGGANGFNQFASRDSKLGVNRIQGFKTQVRAAKTAVGNNLKRVRNTAAAMSKTIDRLAKSGRKAFQNAVSATAKQVLSTTNTIRKLAQEGRIARRHAERQAARAVAEGKVLVAGVRSRLKKSFDAVRNAVMTTASSIASDSVFVGRAKDAQRAMRNIVLGEVRRSGSGVDQIARGLTQLGGLIPGRIGARLAIIGAKAARVAAEARASAGISSTGMRTVVTAAGTSAPATTSATTVQIPGEAGSRLGRLSDQIQNIRDRLRDARQTVNQVKSATAALKKGGIKGAFKSLGTVGKASAKVGVAKAKGVGLKATGKVLAAMGPVGWAIGAGAALIAFGPAIGRAVGRAAKAVANLFSCLFGCARKRRRQRERKEAARKAACLEWITTGRWRGSLLNELVEIAARDWKCRNDVVPPTGDAFKKGSLEQAIATREVCSLWHRAGRVAVVGRSCGPHPDRLLCNEQQRRSRRPCSLPVRDELLCVAGEPFAPAPEQQCGPRTPESIVFALRREPRCVAWQLTGAWTPAQLTPEQQNLFGRGLFFRTELDGESVCGKRQDAICAALNRTSS